MTMLNSVLRSFGYSSSAHDAHDHRCESLRTNLETSIKAQPYNEAWLRWEYSQAVLKSMIEWKEEKAKSWPGSDESRELPGLYAQLQTLKAAEPKKVAQPAPPSLVDQIKNMSKEERGALIALFKEASSG